METWLEALTQEAARAVQEAVVAKAEAEQAKEEAVVAKAEAQEWKQRMKDAQQETRVAKAEVRRVQQDMVAFEAAVARGGEGGEAAVAELARQAALCKKAKKRVHDNETLTREEYESMPESDRDSCFYDRYRGAVGIPRVPGHSC